MDFNEIQKEERATHPNRFCFLISHLLTFGNMYILFCTVIAALSAHYGTRIRDVIMTEMRGDIARLKEETRTFTDTLDNALGE